MSSGIFGEVFYQEIRRDSQIPIILRSIKLPVFNVSSMKYSHH